MNNNSHLKIKEYKVKGKCLSRAHGGFEGGEAAIEGTENGYHRIGDGLTLLH